MSLRVCCMLHYVSACTGPAVICCHDLMLLVQFWWMTMRCIGCYRLTYHFDSDVHNWASSLFFPIFFFLQVTGTVICNNQVLKTLNLSLDPYHMNNHFEVNVRSPFAEIKQGTILEKARVLRVDIKTGLLVKINNKLNGVVHVSWLFNLLSLNREPNLDIGKKRKQKTTVCCLISSLSKNKKIRVVFEAFIGTFSQERIVKLSWDS